MNEEISMEIWKPCPIKTKNPYEVSNMGRVRSVEKTILVGPSRTRPNGFLKHMPSRVMKIRYCPTGYAEVSLDSRPYRVHRLVALAFHAINSSYKDQVNHIDCDKKNNAASNLEWVTGSENIQHAWRHGIFTKEKCAKGGRRGGPSNRGKRRTREQVARNSAMAKSRASTPMGRAHLARITAIASAANTKISIDDVRDIRREYAQGGCSQAALGKRYGVAAGYISRIVNRLVYADIL